MLADAGRVYREVFFLLIAVLITDVELKSNLYAIGLLIIIITSL
jgi:hypothetical protein